MRTRPKYKHTIIVERNGLPMKLTLTTETDERLSSIFEENMNAHCELYRHRGNTETHYYELIDESSSEPEFHLMSKERAFTALARKKTQYLTGHGNDIVSTLPEI